MAGHPDGLVYHHPAWLEVLGREYGQAPVGLACEDVNGELRGVLPLLPTRGLPFGRGGQLTGRRLSSLPRTPLAGPLALDSEATLALVYAAMERVRADPRSRLELKMASDELSGRVNGLVCTPWRLTYVLDLPDRPDALRFGNSRNHTRIKWAVNKATKLGLQVRPATTTQDLRAWYALYLETMRWHALPPRPYRLFEAAWELLRPRGQMRLLLAEQHAAGRTRLLAGSILLMLGRTVFYAFNGRRREDLALRPNDLIQWQAIHDACREGFRHYDFGEVAESHEGLAEFKAKWGAEPRRLYRYYYPAPAHLETDHAAPGTASGRLARAGWQRVPLPVTALVGTWLYRYL